eukprot:TRINITY_DN5920_c0_g1_i1.p1 TRINITY_DN5920_c0_g1~~TRINITY_DN5920_c0_g1_i1.p1  ORF type:complete len:526 (-),score=106.59 TRINITY_DN5920_c0_g1_i1:27-1604(-)
MNIRVEAAKLLRSITVYRKNKSLGNECSGIIRVLQNTNIRALKLALTATLWNLSALAENRSIIVFERGLFILAELLISDDLGLQKEAAGAMRNITLDEECREEFISCGALAGLLKVLSSTEDSQLLMCICGALRNLSQSEINRPLIGQIEHVSIFERLLTLEKGSSNNIQGLTLSTLVNLVKDEDFRCILGKSTLLKVLLQLVSSETATVRDKSAAILGALVDTKTDIPPDMNRAVDTALRNIGLMNDHVDYTQLLDDLDLDETIDWREITLVRKIGEGQYGDVWMAEYHGFPVACKIIKKTLTPRDAEKTIEELRLMKKLKHPNVVLLMGACFNDKGQIMIVTEYASRGDLKTVAPTVKNLFQRLKLALDIANGLSWLHVHNIVHRDLKLPNLLVSEDFTVKVADFGLSLQLEKGMEIHRFGGNVKYSAPEILRARYDDSITIYPYGEVSDVYSFGLMFWELLTLKPLFLRPREYKGKKGLAKYVLEGNRPEIQKNWPERVVNILSSTWHEDPSIRPSFQTIIN